MSTFILFGNYSVEAFKGISSDRTTKSHELAKKYASLEIITPANADERGCQLSIQLHKNGKAVFDYLHSNGVIGDWREPNQTNVEAGVIRIAPVPMYNNFVDVFKFSEILAEALSKHNG